MKKLGVMLLLVCLTNVNGDTGQKATNRDFGSLNSSAKWVEVFSDPLTNDWETNWTLDGMKATLRNSPEGLDFAAGPLAGKNASHAVLWSRKVYEGDIKIEYDYTRMDDATKYVNIIYIHAQGSGEGQFAQDIAKWADLRRVASMKLYFNHMNLYHISYAAFKNNNSDPTKDYIRARRYMPEGKGLAQTDLKPDNFNTGFFAKGIKHHITVIKKGSDLYMKVSNPDKEQTYHWKTDTAPPVNRGRIGLRHMMTRRAIYKNFKVYSLKK